MRDELLAVLEGPDWGGIAALVATAGSDAVASALVALGTADALTASRQLTAADDPLIRRAGLTALIDFRTSGAQEHLFDVLVTTPHPEVRAAALARLEEEAPAGVSWLCLESPQRPDYDPGAEPGLVALLADAVGVPLVRDQVIEAVRGHGNRLGARAIARARPTTSVQLGLELVKAQPLQRECAALLLGAEPGGGDAILALRELARDSEEGVGRTAGRVLVDVDPRALDWARSIIGSAAGRLPGMRVLGAHGAPDDLPALASLAALPDLRSELMPILSRFDPVAVCARARARVGDAGGPASGGGGPGLVRGADRRTHHRIAHPRHGPSGSRRCL